MADPTVRAATIAFDVDFVLTAWDAGAEQLFGWTAREAIGRPVGDVIPGDAQGPERIRALRADGYWSGVAVVADAPNEHVAVRATVTGVRANGRLTGFAATIRPELHPADYPNPWLCAAVA